MITISQHGLAHKTFQTLGEKKISVLHYLHKQCDLAEATAEQMQLLSGQQQECK